MQANQEEGVDYQLCGDDREEDGEGGGGGEDDEEYLTNRARQEDGWGGEKHPEYEDDREEDTEEGDTAHSCPDWEEAQAGHAGCALCTCLGITGEDGVGQHGGGRLGWIVPCVVCTPHARCIRYDSVRLVSMRLSSILSKPNSMKYKLV